MPHNRDSLFYQTKFLMENHRDATWDDAMAHCTEAMKEMWVEELTRLGAYP